MLGIRYDGNAVQLDAAQLVLAQVRAYRPALADLVRTPTAARTIGCLIAQREWQNKGSGANGVQPSVHQLDATRYRQTLAAELTSERQRIATSACLAPPGLIVR